MSFKSEVLQHYLDVDGLVALDREPTRWSTGNGLLYTGLFYTLLALNGELDEEDRARFAKAVARCEVEPGLYNRNPGRPDWEAHDDYVGVAAASYFLKAPFAGDIVDYGEINEWCFDNTKPGELSLKAYHGRFPGRIGFYYMATGSKPGFFRRVAFSSAVKNDTTETRRDAGEVILRWLQVQVAKDLGVCPIACEDWEQSFKIAWGDEATLFRVALNAPEHPFSTWKRKTS